MLKFTHNDLFSLLITVGVMLIFARLLAEIGKKFKLPMVMGEILAWLILGPTVLGAIDPDVFSYLFQKEGGAKIALDGITSMSVIMLLFVAGLEIQLRRRAAPRVEPGHCRELRIRGERGGRPFLHGTRASVLRAPHFSFLPPGRPYIFPD